ARAHASVDRRRPERAAAALHANRAIHRAELDVGRRAGDRDATVDGRRAQLRAFGNHHREIHGNVVVVVVVPPSASVAPTVGVVAVLTFVPQRAHDDVLAVLVRQDANGFRIAGSPAFHRGDFDATAGRLADSHLAIHVADT